MRKKLLRRPVKTLKYICTKSCALSFLLNSVIKKETYLKLETPCKMNADDLQNIRQESIACRFRQAAERHLAAWPMRWSIAGGIGRRNVLFTFHPILVLRNKMRRYFERQSVMTNGYWNIILLSSGMRKQRAKTIEPVNSQNLI